MLFSTFLLVAAAHNALALPGSSSKTASTISCSETYEFSTATVTAMHTGTECPTLTTCPPVPQCILMATKTNLKFLNDPCRVPASTLILSACPTCQTGCSVKPEMLYYNTPPTPTYATPTPYLPPTIPTTISPSPTAQPVFKLLPGAESLDCPRTVYVAKKWNTGSMKTEYLRHETITMSEDCGRCGELVTKGWMGKGPVVRYEGTVTESWEVETRTELVCMEREGVETYF